MDKYIFDRTLVPAVDLNKHGNPNWFTSWAEIDQFAEERYATIKGVLEDLAKESVTIAEIGLRFGYGTHAMIKAAYPSIRYIGIDREDFSSTVLKLQSRFPKAECEFRLLDTQKTAGRLLNKDESADVVYIDAGLGSLEVLRDLDLAWASIATPGVIIINNYTFKFKRSGVKQAVDEFVEEHKSQIRRTTLITSLRGEYVIVRK